MTKQEEIRDGVANIIVDWFMPNGLSGQTMPNERSCVGDVMDYLHSQGVVIDIGDRWDKDNACYATVIEPLIGEEKE